MGTFFKQIYRYTHPRRYRHNENLWPYIKFTRAPAGDINHLRYRGQPVPLYDLSRLADEKPQQLLIVATGPSVKTTDFSPLKKMAAMGVNGAWFKHPEVTFRYYVIIDMTFLDHHMEMVKEVVSQPELIFFTTMHGIIKIINTLSLESIKCRLALIEDACFKIMQPRIFPDEIAACYGAVPSVMVNPQQRAIAFSSDIRLGIFDAGTVAYWALQIAFFMRAQSVTFAGLDMNNFSQPRFYEAEENKRPSFLQEKFSELILPAFLHASRVLANQNVPVYNLSLASAVPDDIFKKVSAQSFVDHA